jgi:hypothetical protein
LTDERLIKSTSHRRARCRSAWQPRAVAICYIPRCVQPVESAVDWLPSQSEQSLSSTHTHCIQCADLCFASACMRTQSDP